MGTVFQALDQRLERTVAVKIIRPELFDQEVLRLRFEREARSVARIDHPGVVSVFDSGEIDGGSLYIVMEWLEGLDLKAVLDTQGPGAPSQVAQLLRQAGAALEAAHQAKLLHRDIKPENLFLGPGGSGFRVKILDFGVAKQLAGDISLTQTGGIIGTPVYMAPEQLAGSDVDERTDLYSLAAVAFQALTGRRTVVAENLSSLLLEVRDRPAPPVSSLVEAASREVDEIFARALERRPVDRPRGVLQWAEEAAAALERLAEGGARWDIRIAAAADRPAPPAMSGPGPWEEATRMFGEVGAKRDPFKTPA
jgi:serine/threonine protein kinase